METLEKDYIVVFVGDYFHTHVSVSRVEGDEDTAIELANNIMKHHYGFDIKEVSTVDIQVEEA